MTRQRVVVEVGAIYGSLTVIGLVSEKSSNRSRRRAVVVCGCGTEKTVDLYRLPSGDAVSCGCRKNEREDSAALFRAKILVHRNGCHLWLGGVDRDGYGKFALTTTTRRQQHVRAHRYAFFLQHGVWPSDEAIHSCDTPRCVNADHLSDASQSTNIIDCVAKHRHPPQCKRFTVRDVVQIRQRRSSGESTASIAASYDAPHATVSAIVHRRTWSWV